MATMMNRPEPNGAHTAEGSGGALLRMPAARSSQLGLGAVLHSISSLLSKEMSIRAVVLLLLNEGGDAAKFFAIETANHERATTSEKYLALANTVFEDTMASQRAVFISRLGAEMAGIPGTPRLGGVSADSNCYALPLASSGKKLGLLLFVTHAGAPCDSGHIEFINSTANHVSTLLQTALALYSAERYKRELETERDRFRLLLEINNHTIAHLEMPGLFRAASVSIRRFFDTAFTGFWVLGETDQQLQSMNLDFAGRQGFLENISIPLPDARDLEKMRARMNAIFGPEEIRALPEALSVPLLEASIKTLTCVPLVGSKGPLGLISLGSKTEAAFTEEDLDLLGKIANQIALALDNALAYGRATFSCNRLKSEKLYLESELQEESNFEDIVGKSDALRTVLDQVAIVAPTDSTVLLIGETGTGKELIAHAIHQRSPRNGRTFVRLNCAAVPAGLVESELFGHEKGAFTGALLQKRGRIELAHEGSLFLDEIGDIDLELQPKLLRVLQEREFERLGSNRTLKVDIRLIAATHRDLPAMARAGEFREDLFYRLNVFPIHIPPLRERAEDIPLLVHYFVATISRRMRKTIRVIPREVMDLLTSFPWPGNVRELQNFVERSIILSRDQVLAAPVWELNRSPKIPPSGAKTLHGVERETIIAALRSAKGKLSGPGGAAERLGLKRTSLQRKMERLDINRTDYV